MHESNRRTKEVRPVPFFGFVAGRVGRRKTLARPDLWYVHFVERHAFSVAPYLRSPEERGTSGSPFPLVDGGSLIWAVGLPLLVRDQELVVEALEALRSRLPVAVRGLDVDNDSAFINPTLISYCSENSIELTRSRSRRKNDQAWVEQKNGAVGETRATHRRKPKPPRDWRTRVDPFEATWPEVLVWLKREPELTGRLLFDRLVARHPDQFTPGQLRTLQRRIREWRGAMARKLLLPSGIG